jgi:hypothetical protein
VTTWGIVICTLALDVQIFTRSGNTDALQWVQSAGWVVESIGFSFVLYSRVHLVTDSRKLKIIPLVTGCLDATIHILIFLGQSRHLSPETWHVVVLFTPAFFAAQETFISSLYVYLFFRFLKQNSYNARTKSMFRFLILAEIFIICLDTVTVTLNSLRFEIATAILTPFFYASKLKVEFLVLNRLKGFRQNENSMLSINSTGCGVNEARQQGSVDPQSPGTASSPLKTPDSGFHNQKVVDLSNKLADNANCFQSENGSSPDDIASLERHYLGRFKTNENV